MPTREQARSITAIEKVTRRDPRKLDWFAALCQASKGGLLSAAESIAGHSAPHLAIITGLYLQHGQPPCCETDGPVGSAHVAAAFQRAGIPCRLVTDRPCAGAVVAAARAAGLPPDFPIDIASVDGAGGDMGTPIPDILKTWKSLDTPLSHAISIERVGPASSGRPHNGRGVDISCYNAPLERLFAGGDWATIGIGDGGNELGMGSIRKQVVASGAPNADKNACVTPCDHLIICGVSNWGAEGLIAAVAVLRPNLRRALIRGLTRVRDRRILKETVYKGPAIAMPGWNMQPARQCMAVDGIPWETHGDILEEILKVAGLS